MLVKRRIKLTVPLSFLSFCCQHKKLLRSTLYRGSKFDTRKRAEVQQEGLLRVQKANLVDRFGGSSSRVSGRGGSGCAGHYSAAAAPQRHSSAVLLAVPAGRYGVGGGGRTTGSRRQLGRQIVGALAAASLTGVLE